MIKRAIYRIFIIVLFIFSFSLCNNNNLSHTEAKTLLLKTLYPKQIKAPFNLCVRYETKEDTDKWNNQQWKKNNDVLEKAGLLHQVIIDTSIDFYIQSQARFEKRHQYLYKAILTPKIKALMINSVLHSKNFDEWDYYNKHTGRKDWYDFEAVCGEFKLDTIINIDQLKGPLDVFIEYKEKFYPTAFNVLADYGKKLSKDETFIRTVTARKYPGEDWKLVD